MNQILTEAINYLNQTLKPDDFPIIIGISGPQGSGKTTLSYALTQYFNDNTNFKACNMLLDDYYLTYEEQQSLNKAYSHVPLLQGRGLPGTHDIDLLELVLSKFKDGKSFDVPNYDKSLCNGKGDRSNDWKSFQSMDIMFLEGWFLGYTPLQHRLTQIYNESLDIKIKSHSLLDLNLIDTLLEKYQPSFRACKFKIIIGTDDINHVYKWRLQQEHDLIKIKGSGMTDDQVKAFIDRYIPVYKLYYEDLVQNSGEQDLVIAIDEDRKVVPHL